MTRVQLPQFVRIKQDYPHHEKLRGEVGLLKRIYGDGTVLIVFESGPHKGDRICLDQRYVELMS